MLSPALLYSRDRKTLLFLSRVTPQKGLPLLLEAIARQREQMTDWLLLIAGPDEFGHVREVKERIDVLGIARFVRLLGPVFGKDRRDAFAAADIFVLPTLSEGAPMVVLEALGARVPVLTTRNAHWGCILEQGCGWETRADADSFCEGLANAMSCSKAELMAKGETGRMLVRRRYTWSIAAQKTGALYLWLAGQGSRPDFVVTD